MTNSPLDAALRALLGPRFAALPGLTRYGEPGWLQREQIDVAVEGLPPGSTLTIGHLSDLHLSDAIPASLVAEAVALLNAQQPDLIVITGDFTTWGTRYLPVAADVVAPLRAPLGVYAVLGNHDYFGDVRQLRALLEARGVRVLVNEAVPLMLGDTAVWLGGLDDALRGRPDIAQTVAEAPAGAVRLLLAHEPDVADQAACHAMALQLSGHTHGGQVRHPRYGPLVLPRLGWRYPQGLYLVNGSATQVYTNRGIGVSGTRLRLHCPPEVSLLTLHSATAADAASATTRRQPDRSRSVRARRAQWPAAVISGTGAQLTCYDGRRHAAGVTGR